MPLLVSDCMTTEVVTVRTGVPLSEAVRLMRLNKIRHLCIVNAEGRLVGIVSDRDLARALPSVLAGDTGAEFTRVLEMTQVGHIMTRAPLVASSSDPLWRAAHLLRDRRIGALPVIDHGQLVGILSTTDCLSAIAPPTPPAVPDAGEQAA